VVSNRRGSHWGLQRELCAFRGGLNAEICKVKSPAHPEEP